MTEPVLEYQKGKGWVYPKRESIIINHGDKSYRVSIEHRPPEPHERAWNVTGMDPAEILDNLKLSGPQTTWGDAPGEVRWGWWAKDRYINTEFGTYVTVVTEEIT